MTEAEQEWLNELQLKLAYADRKVSACAVLLSKSRSCLAEPDTNMADMHMAAMYVIECQGLMDDIQCRFRNQPKKRSKK